MQRDSSIYPSKCGADQCEVQALAEDRPGAWPVYSGLHSAAQEELCGMQEVEGNRQV